MWKDLTWGTYSQKYQRFNVPRTRWSDLTTCSPWTINSCWITRNIWIFGIQTVRSTQINMQELKHTVQLTSMNFHIAYEISKMECKQESLNQMNLSVLPSMNDYNLWADDRQKSIHKLIHFLLETAFQRNYRKRGKDLFEPVIFNKHFTYTFKKTCTISEFRNISSYSSETCSL